MRRKDRESLDQEWETRFGNVARRIVQDGAACAFAPWLRPGQSYHDLRRTVERLRSGAIRLADPCISPYMMADVIEKSMAKEMLVKWIVAELGKYDALSRSIEEKNQVARNRSFVAGFHRLKKSPETMDPESPAAERVRRIDQALRSRRGRMRKRKKRKLVTE